MNTVYSILDRRARSWWYHVQMRSWGLPKQARAKERLSIRRDIRVLREALNAGGYIVIGEAGTTVSITPRASMQDHYDADGWATIGRLVGLPVFDLRTIPDGWRYIIKAPAGFKEERIYFKQLFEELLNGQD